ncbi:NAD(P)H-binding protein [Kitasatospora sp. NPDC008115]|uniref:NAD(P)H-binding protein n=1 Tax=Kitasatospora sp. NPDC008115 TaxID=3364022 RepID=UPI0036EA43A6
MILVIGATAHFGRRTVEVLASGGRRVRALSRTPELAGLPEGVEVVHGDLVRPETLGPALDGVTEMFLVLPHGVDVQPLLDRVRQAGVRQIVFLSSGAVAEGGDPQSDVIAAHHARVEREIRATGVAWTFLRLYVPAIGSSSRAMRFQGGDVVRGPHAAVAAAVAHERDVAEVAAAVLGEAEHFGRIYEPTGPRTPTQTEHVEQVVLLGRALVRELSFEEVAEQITQQQLSQFMDADFVGALLELMVGTAGKPALAVNDTVAKLTGHPARPFAQWVADHLADFR